MQTDQIEFPFDNLGSLPFNDYGISDRTPEHEQNEREAAELGIPYPELTRTLHLTFDGIRYEIFAAILSWTLQDDWIYCHRCDQFLYLMPPCLLHAVPLAMCQCAGALMEPVDDRDRALLELRYPVSDEDKALGSRFNAELKRLTAANPSR
jgi:hypothetical protein